MRATDSSPPGFQTGGMEEGVTTSNDTHGRSSPTHSAPRGRLTWYTSRGGTGSPQQVARINQPPTGCRGTVSRRGDPPVQDPFHRAIKWEMQANQLRGIRLRASIRLRLSLCLLATMEARSGLPLDHTSLDEARTLAWVDRRHGALSTLLVPMPRPSRHTTQATDFPGSAPASTGPAESMAVPDRDRSLHSSGAGATTEAGAPPGAVAHHHHDQGGQARTGGYWQEAGNPSARPELREWVLAVPVAGWDVLATSVAYGGAVRES